MDFTKVRNLSLGGGNYEIISYEDSLKLECDHAAHCGIYSLNSHLIEYNQYPTKAALMMLFRSDGMIGFPGGFVNKETDIMQGLKREIKEEINLDISELELPDPTYMVTYKYNCETKPLCCHFYKLNVPIEIFKNIEKGIFDSEDYGNEIFGVLRVPLYTMKDGHRGLPHFLCNNFIANSRDQLLCLIASIEILSFDELLESVNVYKQLTSKKA